MDLYGILHPHFSPDSFHIEALLLWPGFFIYYGFAVAPSTESIERIPKR
jgi:hypothetical protein